MKYLTAQEIRAIAPEIELMALHTLAIWLVRGPDRILKSSPERVKPWISCSCDGRSYHASTAREIVEMMREEVLK